LISSNQFLQANFEYKIELFINGVLSSVDKKFPKPNGVVKHNVTDLVKTNFQIPNINNEISVTADLVQSMGTFREVYIVVTEVYGTPPAEQATGTSATIDVWKASLSDFDYVDFNPVDYTMSAVGKSPLTIANDWKYWLDVDKNNYVSFYNHDDTITTAVTLRSFDANDTQIDQESIPLGTIDKGIYIVNMNFYEWDLNITNAVRLRLYISKAVLVIDNSQIQKDYYINRPCISDRTVYFFNKLGGIDQQIFNKRKQSFKDFTRQSRGQALTTIDTVTGEDIVLNKFRGRSFNYSNQTQGRITLMSDWLPQEQLTWLIRELLESPIVWMEDENNNKISYSVTNASESEPQERYEDLSQMVIELSENLRSKSALF
jgi:hypothetical protein